MFRRPAVLRIAAFMAPCLALLLFSFTANSYAAKSLKKIKFKARIKKGVGFNYVLPSEKFYADFFGGIGGFNYRKIGLDLNTGAARSGIAAYLRIIKNYSDGWIPNSAEHESGYYASFKKPYDAGKSNVEFMYDLNDTAGFMPQVFSKNIENLYGNDFNFPIGLAYAYNTDRRWTGAFKWKDDAGDNSRIENKVVYRYGRYGRMSFSNPVCGADTTLCILNGGFLPNSSVSWVSPTSQNSYNPSNIFGNSANGTSFHYYLDNISEIRDNFLLTENLPRNTVKFGGGLRIFSGRTAQFWYGAANMPETDYYNDAWDENDWMSDYSGYVQDRIDIIGRRLSAETGIKYQAIKRTSNYSPGYYYYSGGSLSSFYNYWQPSVSLVYTPQKTLKVYAAWGKVVGIPKVASLYISPENYGSAEPSESYDPLMAEKPQYVTFYEIGGMYGNSKGFYLSARAYRSYYLNKFNSVYNPVIGTSVAFNSGSAAEETFRLSSSYGFHKNCGIFAGFTKKYAVYTSNYQGNYGVVSSGENIPYIPQDSADFGGYWDFGGYYFRLRGIYTGAQYVSTAIEQGGGVYYGINDNYKMEGYFLLNAYLSHSVNLAGIKPLDYLKAKSIKLSLSVDNVLNRGYNRWESYTYPTRELSPPVQQVMPGMPVFILIEAALRF